MDISSKSRAPLAERPLTTVRIYTMKYAGLDTPEKQKVLFDNLDRYGNVDEVWLSTLEGNNAMADHRKFIETLKYTASELRKRGILVSIQLSSCVGHFGAPLCEDGFPWTDDDLMVDSEGRKVDGVCCLTGEAFTAWTGDVLALYCRELEIHAAFIDDDVRFHNHGAVQEDASCGVIGDIAQFVAAPGGDADDLRLGTALAGEDFLTGQGGSPGLTVVHIVILTTEIHHTGVVGLHVHDGIIPVPAGTHGTQVRGGGGVGGSGSLGTHTGAPEGHILELFQNGIQIVLGTVHIGCLGT